jgi:hypothetical protein
VGGMGRNIHRNLGVFFKKNISFHYHLILKRDWSSLQENDVEFFRRVLIGQQVVEAIV